MNNQQLQSSNCINNCESEKNKDFIVKRKGRLGKYQREIVEKFYKKQKTLKIFVHICQAFYIILNIHLVFALLGFLDRIAKIIRGFCF